MPKLPVGVSPIDLSERSYAIARISDRLLGTNLLDNLTSRRFGPGLPIAPTTGAEEIAGPPRQFQYPVAVNTQLTPRREYPELTSFEQLRNLARLYDVAALCIATRIEEMQGLPWSIASKDKKQQATLQGRCDAVTAFWQSPDKLNEFSTWMGMLLRDLFEIDALTIYKHPDRGGRLYSLEVVDGSTIKPLLDDRGRTLAYQQILYGSPASQYRRPVDQADSEDEQLPIYAPSELIYRPRWVRSDSPYGVPPTEWILLRVNTALRKQQYDLARFTDSNIPAALAAPPEGLIDVEQIAKFEEWFNATLLGDEAARRRIKFLPWAAKIEKLNDLSEGGRYESQLDDWMLKITCAAYGVTPSEIGFTDDVNKATAGHQENITYRRGIGPLTVWLKGLFDRIIAVDLGEPQLEWRWQFGESEDKAMLAQTDQIYGNLGWIGADEGRALRFPDLEGPAPGPPQAPAAAGGAAQPIAPFGQAAPDEAALPTDKVAGDLPVAPASDECLRANTGLAARPRAGADLALPRRLAKKEPDPADGPDLAARRAQEDPTATLFAAAYAAQQRRIKAALKANTATDPTMALRDIWLKEPALLTQAVLPHFDELVTLGAQEGLAQLPVGVDWGMVNGPVLRLAREEAQAWAEMASATSERQVASLIADWIATGGTMDDLLSRVDRVWGTRRAASAAITGVTDLYARGNVAAWQASAVVKGYRFHAVHDGKVCPICSLLDGKVFPLDDAEHLPSQHNCCRCFATPVVRRPDELR